MSWAPPIWRLACEGDATGMSSTGRVTFRAPLPHHLQRTTNDGQAVADDARRSQENGGVDVLSVEVMHVK